MRALEALLLSDGRPGHYSLAEGIVTAIARLRDLRLRRMQVQRPWWLPARVLSQLVNAGLAPETVLRRIYGIDPSQLGHPDLIVSAGGDTLAANIAAARLTGATNLFYGSLRRYRPQDFALVLTSYAEQAHGPNRLMTLKPSSLDPDDADEHVQRPTREVGTPPRVAGLIVGGNAGTVRYADADWRELIVFISKCSKTWGTRWIVANSPRTPDLVSGMLAGLTGAGGTVQRFIDVRLAGPGTLGPLLENSEAILCTGDSSTMLSECVWMRRPVVAVTPRDWSLPANEASYRSWLADNGWARQIAISELDLDGLVELLDEITPLKDNPLDRLAAQLKERLPLLKGQCD